MAFVYLIRHGQAGFGTQHYDALSPLGQRQAEHLGAWLRTCHIQSASCRSGSMQRQRQTAQLCVPLILGEQSAAPPIQTDERLNEFDYLDILSAHIPNCSSDAALLGFLNQQSGDPRRVFQRLFSEAVAHWVAHERKIDGSAYRERWHEFQQRTQAALTDAVGLARAEGVNVMLFTSGGVISAMVQNLLGIGDERIFDLNSTLLNTGITRLRVGHKRVHLDYLNACPHLELQRQADLQTHR